MNKNILILITLLFISCQSFSNKLNVPKDYSTIQAALNFAGEGDTVIVEKGTYKENIIWPQTSNLKLFANDDSSNCIIDGNSIGSVIDIKALELSQSDTIIIRGFTIKNGNSEWGGGILANNVNIIIENCLITSNNATAEWEAGGGIYTKKGNIFISKTTFKDNEESGITAIEGNIFISKTIFKNNNGYGVYFRGKNNTYHPNNYDMHNSASLNDVDFINHENCALRVLYGKIYYDNGTILGNKISFDAEGLSAGISGFGLFTLTLSNLKIKGNIGGSKSTSGISIRHFGCSNVTCVSPLFKIKNIVLENNKGNNSLIELYKLNIILDSITILNNVANSSELIDASFTESGLNNYNIHLSNCNIINNESSSIISGMSIDNSVISSNTCSNILLRNTDIRNSSVVFNKCPFAISTYKSDIINNTIFGNQGSALLFDNENIGKVTDNNVSQNKNGCIVNKSFPTLFDLRNNYWGDSSGPKHYTNLNGQGDSVSNYTVIQPWLLEPDTVAPPIPIDTVELLIHNSNINIIWNKSLISDFAGYKLYYNTDTIAYPYSNFIDIGVDTSYTFSDVDLTRGYNFSVTVYDINGNESWFSQNSVYHNSDVDNDGINDDFDNCPNTPNPNQEDFNNNDIGDICDDSDDDGIVDAYDLCLDSQTGMEVDENGCEAEHTIEGYVKYEVSNKSSVVDNPDGIQVFLIHNGAVIDTAYTDSTGYYIFYVFNEGEYKINVNLDGYNQTIEMEVVINNENTSHKGVNFTILEDGTITNIGESYSNNSVSIYPNPTQDILYLETSMKGDIMIFDLNGRLALKQQIFNTRNEINVSEFISATYLLIFTTETGTNTLNFIKN